MNCSSFPTPCESQTCPSHSHKELEEMLADQQSIHIRISFHILVATDFKDDNIALDSEPSENIHFENFLRAHGKLLITKSI